MLCQNSESDIYVFAFVFIGGMTQRRLAVNSDLPFSLDVESGARTPTLDTDTPAVLGLLTQHYHEDCTAFSVRRYMER